MATSIQYNDDNYLALMAEFKTLSTFAAVASWDGRAQAEVGHLIEFIQELESEVTEQTATLAARKKAREEKSFFKRLVSSKGEEEKLAKQIEQNQSSMQTLENLANTLTEAIIFSPNDVAEQKALVSEFKQRKKELQLEKKELAAEAKAIRAQAQQASVGAGRTFFLGLYDSKLASRERRSIRYKKESMLRPHENAKAAIERQLLQVERDILWAERFKG